MELLVQYSDQSSKKGNEELENWLLRLLNPRIEFSFFEFESETGNIVVLLEINRAIKHPVLFQGQEYIRIGSYKKSLKEYPEKERELWRIFDATPI
jgi:ATP-dependent DNA helicase RecG